MQTTDIYDPDRIEADRDLLRRFYLKHGYADVRIISAVGEYDPAKKEFVVTYTIDEGSQYRVGTVEVVSNVRAIDPATLRSQVKLSTGSVYNADLVEKSVETMTIQAARHGMLSPMCGRAAIAISRPRPSIWRLSSRKARALISSASTSAAIRARATTSSAASSTWRGRRLQPALIDRAERRLKNLNYFKTVKITNEPGSAPDRVVVNVDVEEQPTGEFSISGGYSTADGLIGEVSIADRNLMGRGNYAKAAVTYGQRVRGFDLTFVEPYFLGYRMAGGINFFAPAKSGFELRFLRQPDDRNELASRLCAHGRNCIPAALFVLPAENHAS